MTFSFINARPIEVAYKARPYTYLKNAVRTVRPIDIAELKSHIKIDFIGEHEENYLNLLIDAAVNAAELFTGRSFINQQWKTFRDFPMRFFTLRRGTNATVDSFKYTNTSGVATVVPAASYYVDVRDPYSQIILTETTAFPDDIIEQNSSLEIVFTAGYGETKADVPAMLRLILMQHVAWLHENKGNCDVSDIPKMCLDGYAKNFRVSNVNASDYS